MGLFWPDLLGCFGVMSTCLAIDSVDMCFGYFAVRFLWAGWWVSWVCSSWSVLGLVSLGWFMDEPESLILAQSERWRHA